MARNNALFVCLLVAVLLPSFCQPFLVKHYLKHLSYFQGKRDKYFNTCLNILKNKDYFLDGWYALLTRFDQYIPQGATIHEYYEGLIDILDKCIKKLRSQQYDFEALNYNDEFNLINDGMYLELLDFVALQSEY